MQGKLDKVLDAVTSLQTGKEVHEGKIADICKDVADLQGEVKYIDKRVSLIEKEQFAYHRRHTEALE